MWVFVLNPLLLIFSLFVFGYFLDDGRTSRTGAALALATRDGLTGLYVIRHFRVLLNSAVVEACKKQTALSIILLDLDRFKTINDTHGHGGSAVLKKLAQIMQEIFPERKRKKGNTSSDVTAGKSSSSCSGDARLSKPRLVLERN